MNYTFTLDIWGGAEGETLIGKIEALTIESLEENLHKASIMIQKYENAQEALAQFEMERQEDELVKTEPSGL